MFYTKTTINDTTIKTEITDENVFTICPECGREHAVDLQAILCGGDADLLSTSVYCAECTEKRRNADAQPH